MSARSAVETVVSEHPGISFSDLKRATGLANGALQYHIHHSDRITQEKGGIIPVGYCDRCRLQQACTATCQRKLLQDPTKRSIVEGLAAGKTQRRIADDLGLDPSTVSYHVKTLAEQGLVEDGEPVPAVKNLLTA